VPRDYFRRLFVEGGDEDDDNLKTAMIIILNEDLR
jgi:hypothetical protein